MFFFLDIRVTSLGVSIRSIMLLLREKKTGKHILTKVKENNMRFFLLGLNINAWQKKLVGDI